MRFRGGSPPQTRSTKGTNMARSRPGEEDILVLDVQEEEEGFDDDDLDDEEEEDEEEDDFDEPEEEGDLDHEEEGEEGL